MADAGRFPKPVRLGEGKNGRLGFVEAEVLAWNAARLEERGVGAKPVNGGETAAVETAGGAPSANARPDLPRRSGNNGARIETGSKTAIRAALLKNAEAP